MDEVVDRTVNGNVECVFRMIEYGRSGRMWMKWKDVDGVVGCGQ